jgi:hypothetical protein
MEKEKQAVASDTKPVGDVGTSTSNQPDQEILNKLRAENEAMRKRQTAEMTERDNEIAKLKQEKAKREKQAADEEAKRLEEQGKYKEMYGKSEA